MSVRSVTVVSCLLTLLSFGNGSKLLCILIDGLRWDYLHQPGLTGFDRLLKKGVRADYLIPAFPSQSYTNYYTIMTGLHPESNGVIDNFMFDPRANRVFSFGYQPSDFDTFWWDQADPLWVTAAKQGIYSYWYMWPGCDVEFPGFSTFCDRYNATLTQSEEAAVYFQQHLAQALDKLQDKTDLAGVYYELIDSAAHVFGPKDPLVPFAVKQVDSVMDWLMDDIKRRHLSDKLNVVIFSDHGMTEVDTSRVVDMTKYVSMGDLLLTVGVGPLVHVWPVADKVGQVYSNLKNAHPHMTVYLKQDIPERFHFRRNERTPPILLLADSGWYITTFNLGFTKYKGNFIKGNHGYDNNEEEMRGIFTAMGPDFRNNHRAPGFPNVDIYQMMCKVLGIKPSPNNGTWEHVESMLIGKHRFGHCVHEQTCCISNGNILVTGEDCRGFYLLNLQHARDNIDHPLPRAQSCPVGTLFNTNKCICDWAKNVNCKR